MVRDDPEVSDFWQRFDDTDGELDTENKKNLYADNYADDADVAFSDADTNAGTYTLYDDTESVLLMANSTL